MREERVPVAGREEAVQVLAPVDGRAAGLVVSVLAARVRFGDTVPVALRILASGGRRDVARGVAELLGRRGVTVAVEEFPGWARLAARDTALRARCLGTARQPASRLVLDVSGCGPESAARALAVVRSAWGRPFLVASFEEGRGTTRFAPSDPAPGGTEWPGEAFADLDVGNPASLAPLRAPAVTPGEVLGIFGLSLVPEDPYGFDGGETAGRHDLLVRSARGILQAFVQDGPEFARFRRTLATLVRAAPAEKRDVRLDRDDIPDAMLPTLEGLVSLGLAHASVTGRGWSIAGPSDRKGVFFLAGGWLEVLVADVLGRSFNPVRRVERNAGTVWGRVQTATSTYAESDAVFVLHNRLYVVSCKNEFREESVLRHVDRFRALAAEYGEAMVRPVLVSTSNVSGALLARCRAYEIGHVSGPRLLDALAADSATGAPHRLLDALVGASQGPPTPGMPG